MMDGMASMMGMNLFMLLVGSGGARGGGTREVPVFQMTALRSAL